MGDSIQSNGIVSQDTILSDTALQALEQFRIGSQTELLTILFTDLENSTQIQREVGDREALRLTQKHREVISQELSTFVAREIEWAGDSCLAVFTKPSDAIQFSLRIQRVLQHHRESDPRLHRVRIGVHLGEVVVQRNQNGLIPEALYGLQVSLASRIMSLARGNQVFCSRSVFDSARICLRRSRSARVAVQKCTTH
jgi:class 3 adenylate cyclase